jgi:hypothetical protein
MIDSSFVMVYYFISEISNTKQNQKITTNRCPMSYHLDCLDPPLTQEDLEKLPDNWYCVRCRSEKNPIRFVTDYSTKIFSFFFFFLCVFFVFVIVFVEIFWDHCLVNLIQQIRWILKFLLIILPF